MAFTGKRIVVLLEKQMKPSRYQRLEFIRLFREKLPHKFLIASDISGKSYRKNMFWIQLKNQVPSGSINTTFGIEGLNVTVKTTKIY